MFWHEEVSRDQFEVSDDVIDLLFDVNCRQLPVDHAHALSQALRRELPWLAEEEQFGVHSIHVAGSQNGWERPEHGTDQRIQLSRRTKLTLRITNARLDAVRHDLEGKTLDIMGCPLTLGKSKPRLLSKQTTLFARYVDTAGHEEEKDFLQWAVQELAAMDIRVRKALCGKTTPLTTPNGPLPTRSLMLADLSLDESLRLQQRGLGAHRDMGCGIFIPHKGIDAVKNIDKD